MEAKRATFVFVAVLYAALANAALEFAAAHNEWSAHGGCKHIRLVAAIQLTRQPLEFQTCLWRARLPNGARAIVAALKFPFGDQGRPGASTQSTNRH